MSDQVYVETLRDFKANRFDQLSYKAGQMILVISNYYREGWMVGKLNGSVGTVLKKFVRPSSYQPADPDSSDDASSENDENEDASPNTNNAQPVNAQQQNEPNAAQVQDLNRVNKIYSRMLTKELLFKKYGKPLQEPDISMMTKVINEKPLFNDLPEEFLALLSQREQEEIASARGTTGTSRSKPISTLSTEESADKLYADIRSLYSFCVKHFNEYRHASQQMTDYLAYQKAKLECLKKNMSVRIGRQKRKNATMISELRRLRQFFPPKSK